MTQLGDGRGGERGTVRGVTDSGRGCRSCSLGTCLAADWNEESVCVCVCVKLQTLLSGLQIILETANEVLKSVLYHGNLKDLF